MAYKGLFICLGCYEEKESSSSNQHVCRECVPRSWLFKWSTYRLTKPDYDAMYYDQEGKCLICEDREAVHIDHCHITGQVRGLLCASCNYVIERADKYHAKITEYLYPFRVN